MIKKLMIIALVMTTLFVIACGGDTTTPEPTKIGTKTYVSTNVPIAIPDNNTNGISSTINVSDGPTVLTKVTVSVDIEHFSIGDIEIYLESPIGTRVEVSTRNGGGYSHYIKTTFDDSALTNITNGSAPFTGSFKPESPLYVLNAENGNGIWKLNVIDSFLIAGGSLTNWSLTLSDL